MNGRASCSFLGDPELRAPGARDRPGEAFLTLNVEHIRELSFGNLCEILAGGQPLRRIEPHVERTLVLEAQSAPGIIDLVTRKSEIGEDAKKRFTLEERLG